MLVIFLFILVSGVSAKILWEKELVPDVNTNSAPLTSCLNKDGNGIIVMTRECPKGKHPVFGGELALWEIGIDGNIARTMPKDDVTGSRIWTNTHPAGVGPGCAIVSNSDLLTIGILTKPGEKKQEIAVISKTDKAEKIISSRNSIENFPKIKMIPLQDNTFVVIGKRDETGLCTRIDSQGTMIEEKLLNKDEINIFSGIDQIKSNDSNLALAIAGVSFSIAANDPNKNISQNSIFICDSNLKTIYEDYFSGGVSQLLFPKVCCLGNGNIAVLYKKESADPNKTLLWTRCYTKELKLLWDKEVFVADKQPFVMDITSRKSGGFTIGIIQYIVQQSNSLELNTFDNEGRETNSDSVKGIIGIGGFNLIPLNNIVVAVFEKSIVENIKEFTIKANAIAID
jgi:hypothetical protein